ncbi:MAG: oxaloacetate decarboxylase subunit alpha, partial [Lachnospiraceae bacterium]|nr:oxaloacetate decarboxylase subunit alpha [Candidatus Equihabitans merdae]
GMLSNLTSQLKSFNAEDRFYDVLKEIPNVRKDMGEPPLVTPSSQIVGTQAVMNVLQGRYKVVPQQTKDVLSGKYGKTVKPFNPEVVKMCIGDEEPITCRPADLLEPGLPKFEAEVAPWKQQDEDVLTYALFPQVAVDYFKYRDAQNTGIDAKAGDTENKAYPV